MVDFRYHVVSIVAVFLALGIGIVVGTTAINPVLLDDLDRNVTRLTDEKRALDDQRRALTAEVEDATAWGKAVSPSIVSGVLSGERVVVVAAPGVSRTLRDDVVKQLGVAGATVTGRIRLADALTDPSRAAELDDLVARELPQGLNLPGTGATAAQRALAELAYVIAVDSGQPATAPAATTRVLAGLRERGFLGVDGPAVIPARTVLVLLPGAPAAPSPTPTASPPVRPAGPDLLTALVGLRRPPAVIAAAPTGGAVAGAQLEEVRADAVLRDAVSSVDDADTVFGQVALVLAIADALRGGQGHYGTGVGANAPIPVATASP